MCGLEEKVEGGKGNEAVNEGSEGHVCQRGLDTLGHALFWARRREVGTGDRARVERLAAGGLRVCAFAGRHNFYTWCVRCRRR